MPRDVVVAMFEGLVDLKLYRVDNEAAGVTFAFTLRK